MQKPDDTDLSDAAWEKFKEIANSEGYGMEHEEDWFCWFVAFEAGYKARMEE
jgi:hypothetical protein